jgi:hypothetical protein
MPTGCAAKDARHEAVKGEDLEGKRDPAPECRYFPAPWMDEPT